MVHPRLCVVGGGARSGKSRFALRLAAERGSRKAFVATAEAYDEEMRARIAAHQSERTGFETIEAPHDLCSALESAKDCDVVLVDCLTLYLSNALLRSQAGLEASSYADEGKRLSAAAAQVETEISKVLRKLLALSTSVIVVTNEVGQGIVPDNALGRSFRDLAGRANQLFAAQADELYLVFFGQPLRLKPPPLAVYGEL